MFTILMILILAVLVLLACVGIKYSHSQFSWSDHADSKAIAQHKELAKSMNSSWRGIFASVICNVLEHNNSTHVTRKVNIRCTSIRDRCRGVRSETA